MADYFFLMEISKSLTEEICDNSQLWLNVLHVQIEY